MNPSTKAASMNKDETMLLLQLVAGSEVINNKTTNATYNKMKEQAWQTLAVDFNSSVPSSRRTPAQLRLRWENLKKAARKRCANMRISRNKTGGGNDYFPPDEVLDKVASLLGMTCTAKRKHKMEEEQCKARTMRDNALTEYLLTKKRKIELENSKIELENSKIELEIRKIELEKRKIELEKRQIELEKRKIELENEEKELHIAKLKLEVEKARLEEDFN